MNAQDIPRLYDEGYGRRTIARLVGCSDATIVRTLKEAGRRIRSSHEATKAAWKAGQYRDRQPAKPIALRGPTPVHMTEDQIAALYRGARYDGSSSWGLPAKQEALLGSRVR